MRTVSKEELEQVHKELRVYGYSKVENFVEPERVAQLLSLVEKNFDQDQFSQFKGRPERELTDKLVYALQNKDKAFIDLLDDPFLVRVLSDCLNDPYYRHLPPDLPNYILSYYNARSSGSKLDLHTDTFVPSPGPQTWTMQVAFALEPSTEANGCTVVVPGSHISGNFVDRSLAKLESITAKPGDVLLWDSRIWHGTKPCTNGASRWMLIATFTTWWVKQRMDIPRSLPEAIYQQLSERQKIVMGYCSIPPKGEKEKLNFKGGLKDLQPSVKDYF